MWPREISNISKTHLQKQDDDFKRTLDEEARKKDALKRRAKAADHKDDEIALLQKQLSELQVSAVWENTEWLNSLLNV